MARIALSKEFISEFHKLSSDVQKKVGAALDKFDSDSGAAGLNLESYKSAADPRARTIRIDKFWRAILVAPEGGSDTYILFAVKPHDQTERWMQKNRFSVNALTQGVEVIDVEGMELALADGGPSLADTAEPAGQKGLLAGRSIKEFRQLGIVDEDLISLVRSITSEDQLIAIAGVLPEAQATALVGLMCGDPVEKIYAEILASEVPTEEPVELEPIPVEDQNLSAAVETGGSRSAFQVVDGSDELAQALTGDFEAWLTFLHPTQLAVVQRDYRGPARITGGAGTGKTVALLHRARRLADEVDPGSRILVTTFTRKLAGDLQIRLKHLGGRDLSEKVKVSTVDALARAQATDGAKVGIASRGMVQEVIQDGFDAAGLDDHGLTPDFLEQEWIQVVLARRVRSRDEYFQVPRTGRGVRLDRRKRADVWRAIETVESALAARGVQIFTQMADIAADRLNAAAIKPFDHILVDESQDLNASQWRLLRAAVAEGENDLFIAGDTHQRIYDNRVSLGQLGIEIRGRATRLKLNYRTTRQILNWSLSLLTGQTFDDLDDGEETLLGYRSATEGPEPEVVQFPDFRSELNGLVEQVKRWRSDEVEPEEIGLCARTNAAAQQVKNALEQSGISTNDGEDGSSGVYVGTMHKMKGLEFRCVAIADVSGSSVPEPKAVTPEEEDPLKHAQDLQRERCLLYVAATRARERLLVTYAGSPSELLHT